MHFPPNQVGSPADANRASLSGPLSHFRGGPGPVGSIPAGSFEPAGPRPGLGIRGGRVQRGRRLARACGASRSETPERLFLEQSPGSKYYVLFEATPPPEAGA